MHKELNALCARIEAADVGSDLKQQLLDEVGRVDKAFSFTELQLQMMMRSRNAINSMLAEVSKDFTDKVAELEKQQSALTQALEEVTALRNLAEQANRAKGIFLANMSHEIRTPLTSILGFAALLEQDIEAEENRIMAELIGKSGKRLMDTLTSVLDMSRLKGGMFKIDLQPLDLCALVQEAAEIFTYRCEEKGLALKFEPAGEVTITADRYALNRIINNLLDNAIRFTPSGTITLHVGSRARHGVLRVSDTGIGMDKGYLDKMFDPFTQESTGHDREYEGTGLGLAIIKDLVEVMQGQITVQSKKHKGTQVTVSFPCPQSVHTPETSTSTVDNL